jgi:hypothetical protein
MEAVSQITHDIRLGIAGSASVTPFSQEHTKPQQYPTALL